MAPTILESGAYLNQSLCPSPTRATSAGTFISGAYTTGSSPIANPDHFNIDATVFSGSTNSTKLSKEQSPIAGRPDTTGVKDMVIPHCFINTSRRKNIKPSLTGLTLKTLETGFMRCNVVDTTNSTIEYRVVTPAIGRGHEYQRTDDDTVTRGKRLEFLALGRLGKISNNKKGPTFR